MEVREGLQYTEEHQWVLFDAYDRTMTIGVTDYGQNSFGEVLSVELPEVGTILYGEELVGTIESSQGNIDIYCPIAGEVIAVNRSLDEEPDMLNTDPYEEGWMIKLRVDESELREVSLLSEEEYLDFTSGR